MAALHADALVFDLDGTLWDTSQTCADAWNRVLARRGIAHRPVLADDVRKVTGKMHPEAIACAFPDLSPAQLALVACDTESEDNAAVAAYGGELYPGVLELVPRLARRLPLFIVSNCQSGYIERFLDYTGLRPHFADFECWGNTRQPKPHNLRAVITRNGLNSPLFVGDTEGDRAAALENRVRFVHAAYGFGHVAGADAFLRSFDEITGLLGWSNTGA